MAKRERSWGPASRTPQGLRVREEILDAASKLMSQKGYDGASIASIMDVSGLPRSSIYWQFESKAAIAAAVMERGARAFLDATPLFAITGTPEERLEAYVTVIAANLDQHQDFHRLFLILTLTNREPSVREVLERVRSEAQARMHQFAAAAFEVHGSRAALRVADRIAPLGVAMFDGYLIANQFGDPDTRHARIREVSSTLAQQGMAVIEAVAPRGRPSAAGPSEGSDRSASDG